MENYARLIAINVGDGYVPGIYAIITGAVLAANELGWEVVGIRDGYDGLLFPDRYPDGGLIPLSRNVVENLFNGSSATLGSAVGSDPFHVRTIHSENRIEEVDRSGALLDAIKEQKIDAVISVVGPRALAILWKLSRKGLKTVAVPKSVENDMAATELSFGFNSALSFATEIVDRARQSIKDARRIDVVEVLGEQAGWLALQAGMAVCADAVLIPEIPYDLEKVAAKLRAKLQNGRHYALVVVAEGAAPVTGKQTETVSVQLQRLMDRETCPLAIGQLVRDGSPTAVDRQLGLRYGASAVRALKDEQSGSMVVFQPDLKFVPLAAAINRVRRVPANSEFVHTARSLGISLGD